MKINIKNYITSNSGKIDSSKPFWENPLFDENLTWLDQYCFNSYLEEKNSSFVICKKSTHDGTMIFQHELICELLDSIPFEINKFFTKRGAKEVLLNSVELGDIDIETEFFDQVDLPAGKFPGQVDKVRLPIKLNIKHEIS